MINNKSQIYLASSSPRRQELLHQIGVNFKTLKIDIDETQHPEESAKALVQRLAKSKAQAGLSSVLTSKNQPRLPILAADTLVVCDGAVLGKPQDKEHALHIWTLLSGRSHQVITAVALIDARKETSTDSETNYSETIYSETTVTFRTISEAEMQHYWLTREPCDKAGAYAIQGLGAIFVQHINGSYSGVVGLPLYETHQLLLKAEIA